MFNTRRWCALLCALVFVPALVHSGSISMSALENARDDLTDDIRDSKDGRADDPIHTLSDGEESVAALERESVEAERRKSPANESLAPAEVALAVNRTAEVTMAVHNDVAPEEQLDAGDMSSPCGRYKDCTMDDWAAVRIEKLKRIILKKLKLERPPNVTAKVPRNSPPVLEMMRRHGITHREPDIEVEGDEEIESRELVSVAQRSPYADDSHEPCCYFNIAQDTAGYEIQSAFLWIFINGTFAGDSERALVRVNRHHAPLIYGLQPRTTMVRAVVLKELATGWRRIDVTSLVRSWVRRPYDNYGISIHASGFPGLITMSQDGESTPNQPFIAMNMTMLPQRRKRDTVQKCTDSQTDPRCCLYDLEVNFEAIGWDWIIYPTKFNARLCSGECTMLQGGNLRNKVLNHADLARGRLASCCVPKKMISISMLYHDSSSNIVYSRVPDMAITSCDCL